MKFNKRVFICVFSLIAIFASSSLAEQSGSPISDAGLPNRTEGKQTEYRLTDAEKREIEEQSVQLHLEGMKANYQKEDNQPKLSIKN